MTPEQQYLLMEWKYWATIANGHACMPSEKRNWDSYDDALHRMEYLMIEFKKTIKDPRENHDAGE